MATSRQVHRAVVLPAPTDRVWSAVADPAALARWLGVDLDVDLHPGAQGRADEDGQRREVVVETVDPGRRLAFSWWPEDEGPDAGSTVEIRLAPTGGGTRVSVRERAIADVPVPPSTLRPTGEEVPAHAAGEPPLAYAGAAR